MLGEELSFSVGSESVRYYFSKSATGAGPGIVVLQEWWGLVPHIMDVCDRFAAAGFNALAPDLYNGKTTTEPDEAASLMQALHIGETEAVLRKAILVLMAEPSTVPNDKIGVVGFCMGGQLAMFAASANPVIKGRRQLLRHPPQRPTLLPRLKRPHSRDLRRE